jgi:hypothetical protein
MLVTGFRIKYTLYKIILPVFQLFDVGRMHPVRERALRAFDRSVDYIEANMPEAMSFETQKELLAYTVDAACPEGHYLEFGVFTGGTMRFLAKRKPECRFHGFDSFEGLPEDWSGFWLGKSAFSVGGKLPRVPGNVALHKGWFSQTLPDWRASHPGKVAFMHIDCDLYSSTVDILENLADGIQAGTVIVFDEYFNYPNWERHEFKAWKEFVAKYRIDYEYMGFARQQVAVRVTRVGGP